ncbi:hypothetical protein GO755_39285 [Spirosoma sp. HMF4905]|uniref:Uncharacterized protein n=1 Tax=Spirosoma arboris TaxID=2682092 RepID=A0A7K1SQQ3_9BACT|nr:hypothetical protein [Spirosoma arboris]MVM36122.1 hypothetical protein [Spirosoma arboris]
MNTNQPTLSQIKAIAQLAEMAYNADQTEHKKAAWDKAQTEYEQAAKEVEQLTPETEPSVAENFIQELGRLEEANRQLEYQKHSLEQEVSFLKNQLNEKDQKIDELEKLAPSANSATPAVTPVVEKAAAQAEAAKKNS